MITDGRTVPDGEVVQADLCVVGGGPAGITIANELTHAGLEVVLLERGPLRRERPPDPVETAVNSGLPYPVNESRAFEFGGATYSWRIGTPLGTGFGRFRELDEPDFSRRPWIPDSGWPIGKDQLEPFYGRVRSLFDLPWAGDANSDRWQVDIGEGIFAQGNGIETRPFYFVNPGIFAGNLLRKLELSEKALVLSNSVATEIRTDEYPSRVSSLRVRTSSSHGYTVNARIYVLAAGGIENARLLLASTSRCSAGIGNQHDVVGRFFMEHPHYASGFLLPENNGIFDKHTDFGIYLYRGVPVQKKYSLAEHVLAKEGLSPCAFRLEAKPKNESVYTLRYGETAIQSLKAASELRRGMSQGRSSREIRASLFRVIRGVHHLGRFGVHRARVRLSRRVGLDSYIQPHLFWIRAMAEQTPDRNSRLFLRRDRDRLGVPLVELNWQLNAQDRHTFQRSQELLGLAWEKAGIGRVQSLVSDRSLPPALSGGNHHMGTTRMSSSSRKGVADKDCRVHDVDNLYLAGSSLFPTGGYANPTMTLLALAFRLSDHLQQRFQSRLGLSNGGSV